jgi:hypothetical protein
MSIDLPTLKPSWTRFIVDYNPCFLLSAICMLVGCRLLNDAINLKPGDVKGALWLVLTINVYEFSLLAVATLIRSRLGMRRDVGILLVVGVFFMADIVFVVGDLSTARPDIGAWLAAGLTLLAIPKAWLAMWLIDSPKRLRVAALVAMQMAVIVVLPVVLQVIAHPRGGKLPLPALYAAWWFVGLLPIVMTLVLCVRSTQRLSGLAVMYVLVPYLAIVGHALACTWVYKLPFYAACYSPVLLGLAVSAGMLRSRFGLDNAVVLEWLLAAVGLLLSANADPALTAVPFATPLRVAAVAACTVNLHGLMTTGSMLFSLTLAGMALGAVFGPLWPIFSAVFQWIAVNLIRLARFLWPRTKVEWGLWAVGSSFLLLLAGTVLSLWKRPVRHV